MDGEEKKFQFLGFFGILKEAYNIITSHRKIFSQITLSVILPLSLIYFVQKEISFGKIIPDKNVPDDAQMGSQKYSNTSDMLFLWLFRIAFFIFSIILFLFSTSAVVYTVACIYTEKEITYKKVMKVVPKVWKRLMITFLWNFGITFGIIMGASLLIIIVITVLLVSGTLGQSATAGIPVAIIVLLIIPLLGIAYLSLVWQLANVISVLEDVYGIQALRNSKNLIKGNTGVCVAFFLTYNVCYLGIDQGFKASAVGVDSVWGKILLVCLWSMIMSMLSLFGLVIQTIIYFICKSYHNENIDKSSLSNHLEVYSNRYVPLDTKEVHMQDSMV
ncbi:Polyadenylate-binding protein 1-B-binding protein [Heracleum sosnowskyi]|uniref:Polyadenylate-binding protein 1-B-binding protein n=1 Tax=Heracleum sosnowskyi TaxID=360622 RepID=A0AAD8N165_9APIA|nr:Polyadenylate-binding protein 1-B-binding protein [Heracleum sosnowskyi]